MPTNPYARRRQIADTFAQPDEPQPPVQKRIKTSLTFTVELRKELRDIAHAHEIPMSLWVEDALWREIARMKR